MKKKSFVKSLKDFYQSKRGKSILFFSFYIVFFLVLFIFLKNNNIDSLDKKENNNIDNKFSISNITNTNYKYDYEINDNNNIINFSGTRLNVDYLNYQYNYFLNIYNINQLIKKSKFIERKDNVLKYELENNILNDLLGTNRDDGINKIDVYVDSNNDVKSFNLDLSSYLEKNIYMIKLNYKVGENNE